MQSNILLPQKGCFGFWPRLADCVVSWGANDSTPTADNYEATAHKIVQCPILSLKIMHESVFMYIYIYAAYDLDAFLYNEAWKLDVLDLLFMVGPQSLDDLWQFSILSLFKRFQT